MIYRNPVPDYVFRLQELQVVDDVAGVDESVSVYCTFYHLYLSTSHRLRSIKIEILPVSASFLIVDVHQVPRPEASQTKFASLYRLTAKRCHFISCPTQPTISSRVWRPVKYLPTVDHRPKSSPPCLNLTTLPILSAHRPHFPHLQG